MPDPLALDLGAMRSRVTLESLSEVSDGYGQMLKTWSAQGTYWAKVRTPSGREVLNAQQLKAEVEHVLEMRWNPDFAVTPTLRLTLGSRIFSISAVINVLERNVKMLVFCTEQVVPTVP